VAETVEMAMKYSFSGCKNTTLFAQESVAKCPDMSLKDPQNRVQGEGIERQRTTPTRLILWGLNSQALIELYEEEKWLEMNSPG
jgi:hypothetical protein